METKTVMVEKKITIIWNSMVRPDKYAELGFMWQMDETKTNAEILNQLFRETNLYAGEIWELIEEILPADRPHTALSVGDLIVIDGTTYRCDDFGWKELGA